MDKPVDYRGGNDVAVEDLAPAPEGLFEVTIREARS
jgi:hypothetical protein